MLFCMATLGLDAFRYSDFELPNSANLASQHIANDADDMKTDAGRAVKRFCLRGKLMWLVIKQIKHKTGARSRYSRRLLKSVGPWATTLADIQQVLFSSSQ